MATSGGSHRPLDIGDPGDVQKRVDVMSDLYLRLCKQRKNEPHDLPHET
jgi:hypothetical protein